MLEFSNIISFPLLPQYLAQLVGLWPLTRPSAFFMLGGLNLGMTQRPVVVSMVDI